MKSSTPPNTTPNTSLAWILDNTVPGDYPGKDWGHVFSSLQLNHYESDKRHWDAFFADIKTNGVRSPVLIVRRNGQWEVKHGHHRIWAASKTGRTGVPTRFKLTAADRAREARLRVGAAPRWIRCYDNGGTEVKGGSIDRYTVIFTGRYRKRLPAEQHAQYGRHEWIQYLAMNGAPFWPQGFCQHGEARDQIDLNKSGFAPAIGHRCHLGVRIPFGALPDDCQRAVWQDYSVIWGIRRPVKFR